MVDAKTCPKVPTSSSASASVAFRARLLCAVRVLLTVKVPSKLVFPPTVKSVVTVAVVLSSESRLAFCTQALPFQRKVVWVTLPESGA